MSDSDAGNVPPVAIVGVSALLPGAPGADGFWRTVVSGADRVSDVPATHWLVDDYYHADPATPDRTYARRGAFLSPVPFDPIAFGIPPNTLAATDTSQLLALVVAERLLSSLEPQRMSAVDRERVSVILGTSALELLTTMAARMERPVWLAALRENGIPEDRARAICDRIAEHYVPWQEGSLPGMLSNVVAGRIANRFDLHGSNYTTDAACASSLAALSSGINELALGHADLVVTGGVDTLNDPVTYTSFSKTPALSPTGDCRPFSADADGMILGEGVVMFALRRLHDAERDGDRIFAVIRGIGTASDGRGGAIYAPQSSGQARALRRAYEMAGYGPDTVELVEAHGTGTAAGDAAEVAALRAVFGETGRADTGWCALGLVKSQIGHTKNAAGAAGLLKATLALHHRVLPPTIKVNHPNPALGLDGSPFYLNTTARPWISAGGHPRRAGVSSFGFGGTDFHITLEEYVPATGSAAPFLRAAGSELVLLSADSPSALVAAARALTDTTDGIVTVARKTQEAFDPAAAVRLGVIVTEAGDLATTLHAVADRIVAAPAESFEGPGGVHYRATVAEPGPIGFLFSGQGSQYVGMGAELAMVLPAARESWDAVAAQDRSDHEALHRVVFAPPTFSAEERAAQQARLRSTEQAQPALAAQSLATLALLRALDIRPDAVGGHSFGELVALHAAGCFDRATLLYLARRRGELMRDTATEPGAMTAVIGTLDEVQALVESAADGRLWVANHNAPEQVVVSGATSAVAAFERQATEAGHTVRRLEAAGAFHTPLVAAAATPWRDVLDAADLQAPRIPVYGNSRGTPYPAHPDAVRAGLAEQLIVPVRFVDQIEAMYADGIRTFIEVGAGATLTRLVGEILAGREHLAVSLDRATARGMQAAHDAMARLAVGGLRLDFTALWRAYNLRPDEETMSKEQSPATVKLLGANYGKPYPPADGSATLSPPHSPTPAPPAESALMAQPPSLSTAAGSDWLEALRETQRLASEAHIAYQRTMAESHLAFLRLSEAALVGLAGGTPAATLPAPAPITHHPLPNGTAVPVPDYSVTNSIAAPAMIGHSILDSAPMPPAPDIPATTREPHTSDSLSDMVSPPGSSADVAGLLSVVAEKTGYPVDVLDVGMELESDLGIDSIKRVEILSAVRQRFPGVREVDAATLGAARTLAEVADLLGAGGSPEASRPAGEPPPDATMISDPTPLGVPANTSPVDTEPAVRLTVRPVPRAASGLALPGLRSSRVAITGGKSGLAELLATELIESGVDARVDIEPAADIQGLIHLGTLGTATTADAALTADRDAFRLARTFVTERTTGPGIFVTVQDTGSDFGRSGAAPTPAGLAALARTAAREWRDITVKAIDCDTRGRTDAAIARAIARELLDGGASTDVGLTADGRRTVLDTVALPPGTATRKPAGPHSVIVVSGGARGVTAAALRALAEAGSPRLVLIGRTPLTDEPSWLRDARGETAVRDAVVGHLRAGGETPDPRRIRSETAAVLAAREVRETLRALQIAGSPVRYVTADVTDTEAVRTALADIRTEWGPITGLVHGAGVLADKAIRDKSDEQFDRVFDTKVGGLRSLLAAVADDPLELLCVFSSVAACYGNAGQSDYAMANEIITQLAATEHRRRENCLVRAIAWGPWDGGMVDESLAAHFRATGMPLMSPAAGAKAFIEELCDDAGPVCVLRAAGHPGSASDISGELAVTARDHSYLFDHQIGGLPVVPVALVLEWFTGVLRAALPGGDITLSGIEVLSKIALDDFAARGRTLRLTADRPDPVGPLTLTVSGPEGRQHFRARAAGRGSTPRRWTEPTGLQPLGRETYDGRVLFHGPAFQVLTAVDGIAPHGAAGMVTGTRGRNWPTADRNTDPAAVDGALQLATLWAEHVLGAAVLPMGIAEFRLFVPGPLDSDARVVVLAGRAGGSEADCDVQVCTTNGRPLFELGGVRLIARPDITG